ncbi:MAG: hypothetical protein ACPLKX_07140 [Dictyoglomaceae bacterium]
MGNPYGNVLVHKVVANVFVSNLPADMLSYELYRKRMKIEEKVLGRWLTVYMFAFFTVYLLTKMEERRRRARGLVEELEKGIYPDKTKTSFYFS